MRVVIDRFVNRLDALSRDAARLRHPEVDRLLELASVATMHAVALETLRAQHAEAVWRDAHMPAPAEPPAVERRIELPERLAA